MNKLTLEEILFMHYRIVTELQGSGASYGLLHPNELKSALERPLRGYGDVEAHPDNWSKAAALAEGIIDGHPFEDGNKRVGITAGCVFLMMNDYSIEATDDDIYEAAMKVARSEWRLPELQQWFAQHSTRSLSAS